MGTAETSGPAARDGVFIEDGVCHVYFAYDVGMGINLEQVQKIIGAGGQRQVVVGRRRTPRTPEHFGYLRPPLRISDQSASISIGAPHEGRATRAPVELLIFDFGAVSVMYTIPLVGPTGRSELATLVGLSAALYENAALHADSRRRVEELVTQIRTGVKKPFISPLVEDYAVFHLRRLGGVADEPAALLARPALLASILRSEAGELSAQEIEDAMSCRISYSPRDLTLIDWNGSLVVGDEMEDVLAVLEYANMELLEMRFLDGELDRAMERAHGQGPPSRWRRLLGLGPPPGGAASLHRIAELQVDAAVLFEGVNNSLKMLGDQYLARVYRLASDRLHLAEWDASILRKLGTLESMYEKAQGFQANRRMELLEWIIILLIAFEIVLSFIRY